MRTFFDINNVNGSFPRLSKVNKDCLTLSLLEHLLLDKGFDVDITTPDVRNTKQSTHDLEERMDYCLECMFLTVPSNTRIKVYPYNNTKFAIELY